MPIHNWKKVDAGIFHDFHQRWCITIGDALNAALPPDHYALIEQSLVKDDRGRFGPDVLTLHTGADGSTPFEGSGGTALLAPAPKLANVVFSDAEYYRRKKNVIAIRHVSDDRIVASIELVSPGNKSGNRAVADFVTKACELLIRGIHLMIVDLFPPTPRVPKGIQAAIWMELEEEEAEPLPEGKDRVAVSYECLDGGVRGYVEPIGLGEPLPDMPIFLRPDGCVMVPLEKTYSSAFSTVPARWRRVIED